MRSYPHIRVKGSPRDRGRQVGEKAAERIARSLQIYRGLFRHYAGWEWSRVRDQAGRYRSVIEALEVRYLEEINGMAEGAGQEPVDLLALNVRTEIIFAAVAKAAAHECTAFVVLPEATVTGHTLIGQNWDWNPSTKETVIVLEAEQDEGPDYVTVVEAGLLAKAGFNSAGIGLATNALVTDQDRGEAGVPYHVVLRAILDAEGMSEALAAINHHPRASAANYLIAHRNGEALNVEAAPGDNSRTYLSYPEGGIFAHSNHFTDPGFSLNDMSLRHWSDSRSRFRRMRDSLKREHGNLSPEKLRGLLSDHFYYPNAICSHPDVNLPPPERGATVASLIMDLDSRKMWLADGNPCQVPFRELDYQGLLSGKS